jgi:hypothetical protein
MINIQEELKKILVSYLLMPIPHAQQLYDIKDSFEDVIKKMRDLPAELRTEATAIFAQLLHKYGLI